MIPYLFFLFFSIKMVSLAPPPSLMHHRSSFISEDLEDAMETDDQEALEEKTLEHLKKLEPHLIAQQSKEVLLFLVHNGYDLNCTDRFGYTAFHYACQHGQLEAVKNLLECGACLDKTTENSEQWNGFLIAVHAGHLETVRYLLSQQIDMNAQNSNGETALHLAVQSGHLPLVQSLLHFNNIKTALYLASQFGHIEQDSLCHRRGIDINAPNSNGETALHLAVQSGHLDIVHHLLNQRAHINKQNNFPFTLLHFAIKSGHLDIVQHLIRHGIHMHTPYLDRKTAFDYAAQYGHLHIVKYILSLEFNFTWIEHYSQRALQIAAQFGHLHIVKYILAQPFYTCDSDPLYQRVFQIALQFGHLHIVKYLSQKGYIPISTILSVLDQAISMKDDNMIHFLLSSDRDDSITFRQGNTILHHVCQNLPEHKVIKIIILCNDINKTNDKKITALHITTRRGFYLATEQLLKQGAHVDTQVNFYDTPLAIAISKKNLPMIKLFLKYGVYTAEKEDIRHKYLKLALLKGLHIFEELLNAEHLPSNEKVLIYQKFNTLQSILSRLELESRSEVFEKIQTLLRQGYQLTDTDISYVRGHFSTLPPTIKNLLNKHMNYSDAIDPDCPHAIDLEGRNDKKTTPYFYHHPQKVGTRYPWDKSVANLCLHGSDMSLPLLKLILQSPHKFRMAWDPKPNTHISSERWIHEKVAHFAFTHYFETKTKSRMIRDSEFSIASDIRFYLFGKGILPAGFSYNDIQPFFSFWLKALLERDNDEANEEIARLLNLGAIGTLHRIYLKDTSTHFSSKKEEEKRLKRIERIEGFKDNNIRRMLSFFQLYVFGDKAPSENHYPYLKGEIPSNAILDFLKNTLIDQKPIIKDGRNTQSLFRRKAFKIQSLLQALINSIYIGKHDISTAPLVELYSYLSEIPSPLCIPHKDSQDPVMYSPLGHHLDDRSSSIFLQFPFPVSFNIMVSHGLTTEKSHHLGRALSLEEMSLTKMPHIFLLMELGLFELPILQHKYSVSLRILQPYKKLEEKVKFIEELCQHHKRLPLVFRRSSDCFICLLYASLEDDKYQNWIEYIRNEDEYSNPQPWHCPFDTHKDDDFDSLEHVANHLHVTPEGPPSPCEHFEKFAQQKDHFREPPHLSFPQTPLSPSHNTISSPMDIDPPAETREDASSPQSSDTPPLLGNILTQHHLFSKLFASPLQNKCTIHLSA